jgi:hypothetical protein
MPEASAPMSARPPTSAPEPLSQSLARLVEAGGANSVVSTNQLLERTEGRGTYLVMLLLALPFVAWVSVPGMSTLIGPIIGLLALRLARNKPPRLPSFLGDRQFTPKTRQAILAGGLKFCRFLERFVRPRRTTWMTWRVTQVVHALLIVFMAFLLALPLPSPPFFGSNALPSYAIILLAVSMMEADGVLILFGYLAAGVAATYFVLFWNLMAHHLVEWWGILLRLLERAG